METCPVPDGDAPPQRTGPICNICDGDIFLARGSRIHAHCAQCHADERARLIWLNLTTRNLLRPGLRVLHMAPERAISDRIRAIVGDGYDPVDFAPELFPHVPGIRPMDLSVDAARLPSDHYDLILHSHVMEHIRCNVWAVLWHLHRALRPDGHQVCCIPIMRDTRYAEDLGPLASEDAAMRFGQDDHVRRFGGQDIQATLGMVFRLPETYDLLTAFESRILERHAIPRTIWTGWSPNSVLVLAKTDLLLSN